MKLEDYLPDLEEETGPIKNVKEWAPGVYYIETGQEEVFAKEFFAVLDGAPMAAKVQKYGKKMDGLRLFALDDAASGWRIVQYEISKYRANHKRKPVPEEIFHDLSLHAIEVHPEYFGTFPVPYHTPDGYTLRHRTLANGIYWLETSTYKELLHSGTFFPGESYNGQRMQLKIYDLCKIWYDTERQEKILDPVCNGTWDFGEITIDLPYTTIHLEPNIPVTTLDVEATITEIMISPISVLVRIEGDALKGHHAWVPKNARDGYYGCVEYQEIILYSEDGSTVTAEYTRGGTGCWGGEADSDEEGMLLLQRFYALKTNYIPRKLVDVDSLTAISVCGVMIPLK